MTHAPNPVRVATPPTTPRARRGDVAVFAQYIQDITRAGDVGARPVA